MPVYVLCVSSFLAHSTEQGKTVDIIMASEILHCVYDSQCLLFLIYFIISISRACKYAFFDFCSISFCLRAVHFLTILIRLLSILYPFVAAVIVVVVAVYISLLFVMRLIIRFVFRSFFRSLALFLSASRSPSPSLSHSAFGAMLAVIAVI